MIEYIEHIVKVLAGYICIMGVGGMCGRIIVNKNALLELLLAGYYLNKGVIYYTFTNLKFTLDSISFLGKRCTSQQPGLIWYLVWYC